MEFFFMNQIELKCCLFLKNKSKNGFKIFVRRHNYSDAAALEMCAAVLVYYTISILYISMFAQLRQDG